MNKARYTGKEVSWMIIIIIGVILLFTLEVLWFQSMEVKKLEIKNCEPINYTSNDYIAKSYCSNTFEDVWFCNMREKA